MENFTFHEMCQMADFLADLNMSDSHPLQRLRRALTAPMTNYKTENYTFAVTVSEQNA